MDNFGELLELMIKIIIGISLFVGIGIGIFVTYLLMS